MAKSTREKIKLISSSGTKHFYTSTKSKKGNQKKIKIKKYDPKIRKHVIYNEAKIK